MNAPAPASSKPESKRPDSGSSGAWDAGERGSVDRVLLDYFSLGRRGEVSGSPDAPSGPRTIDQVLGKGFPLETVPPPPIRCLIATLADPVHTTSGYHFDEGLTAILRGIEAKHYVLDRYRLPAPRSPAGRGCSSAAATRETTRRTSRGRPPRPPRCCWSSSCPSRRPRASTRARWPRASTGPRRCDDHRRAIDPERPATNRPVNILGPAFTGSQASLELTLQAWIAQRPGAPPPHFEVVSGSASGIDSQSLKKNVLKKNVKSASGSLRYRTTVHGQRVVEHVMCAFLGGDGGAGVGRPIALLYESNTGYGQAYGQATKQLKERGCPEIHYYPFPQNVARIRAHYEKQDESGGASQFLPPSERLVPGSDGAKWPLDLIAPQTPEFTTPLDELVIDEILMDISHREIRTVGITATDARRDLPRGQDPPDDPRRPGLHDRERPRLHSPRADRRPPRDVRRLDLSPPARNQSWSYPYRGEQRSVFFTSDGAQGIYNATVLQLHDLLDKEPVAQTHFVEYGRPFALPGGTSPQGTSPETCPPVWIGVVGNHGIYPVHVDDGTPRDRDPTARSKDRANRMTSTFTSSSRWPARRRRIP